MSKHKNDLAIIEHAIQVADYHGGSFNLKDAFRHIKHFLSGEKKGRKKEQKLQEPNDYAKEHFGFDPKEKKPKINQPKKKNIHMKKYQNRNQNPNQKKNMNLMMMILININSKNQNHRQDKHHRLNLLVIHMNIIMQHLV
jgi:hypothetical protein